MTNGIKLLSEAGAAITIIDGSNTSTVIYIFGTTIDTTTVINGFTLLNGTADAGGGISCLNASPKIENCIIENNEGGGGSFTNSHAILRDSYISENSGSGIKAEDNSNLYIFECLISNNSSEDGGGIFCEWYSNPSLENVTITGNSASDFGGGIYSAWYSDPSLENVTISGNSSTNDGGGIFCDHSDPSLNNVTITGNTSSDNGGGIYLEYDCDLSIENAIITNNSASDNGGGICCKHSDPSLDNVTITGNSADNGGGIYVFYDSDPSLEDVIISCNSADNGGGIYCSYSSLSLSTVTITQNSSNFGGAIFCTNSNPVIEYCTITDNCASENGDGIYTTDNSDPTVQYSNIMLNGYGIFNSTSSIMIAANNNFWGDVTGPYHQFYNPGGLGDSVNQYVNPIPFLTEADINAPPIPPYGLDTLAVGDDFVTINWQNTPIGDLLGYKVHFDSDYTGFPYSNTIDVGIETSYTLTELTTGTTYYIAVSCYDVDSNESWFSREIEVTPGGADVNNWNISINNLVLYQNYPNPFNPITTISYQIQKSGNINIEIYNIKGQLVETLVNEQQTSGSYSVTWDAKGCSSGIYLYKLKMNGKSESVRRCLLLK